jgi:hypothetical protein
VSTPPVPRVVTDCLECCCSGSDWIAIPPTWSCNLLRVILYLRYYSYIVAILVITVSVVENVVAMFNNFSASGIATVVAMFNNLTIEYVKNKVLSPL